MSINRRYLDQLERMREHLQALVEQTMVESSLDSPESGVPGTWAPAVDLVELDDAYLVLAELPGVSRDELELHVSGRRLELSGRRQAPEQVANFHRMERNYGPFRRTFELSEEVDSEAVEAQLRNGVLEVRLPKASDRRRSAVTVEIGDDSA